MVNLYTRLVRGWGDGVMLRPSIIGSMKQHPQDRHILHCLDTISCMFRDIDNLQIVEFDSTGTQRFDMDVYQRLLVQSQSLASKYEDIRIIELISECNYESDNAPYKIENGKYIPTGKTIALSRQRIWCQSAGVPFDMDNYNVKFFPSEHEYADKIIQLCQKEPILMIHLKSADAWRSYNYQDAFIDYFAKKWQGIVIVLDHEYKGFRKNVLMLDEKDIRKVWCLISKAKALIGADSFGIHASGSTNVKTYGIFGPTDPDCRLEYPRAMSSGAYVKCKLQYCWYRPCKYVPCMNARKPSWYWEDFRLKIGKNPPLSPFIKGI